MKTLKKLWMIWERLIIRLLTPVFRLFMGRHHAPLATYEVVCGARHGSEDNQKRGFFIIAWNSFASRPLLIIGLILIIALIPAIYFSFLNQKRAEAAWYDDSWLYRTALTINNSGSADSNKKVKFDIDTATLYSAGKIQLDCGDSRFTDINGRALKYYIDSASGACNTNSTDYYVLVPTINAGATVIYHYYDNPAAANGTQLAQFSEATFSPSSTTAASEEQSQGPVAYWKFDDGTGTVAQDATQNNNDGTFGAGAAAPTWQTEDMCVSGKCLKFDGSDDYVSVNDSSSLRLTSAGTISLWVKFNTLSANNPLVSKKLVTWNSNDGYQLYWDDASGGIIDFVGTGSSYERVAFAPTIGKWYHIEAVIDSSLTGANMVKIYINGVLQTATTEYTAGALVAGTQNLRLGYESADYPTPLNGFLDEVKIYPYARSAAQIKADYASAGSAHGSSVQIGSVNPRESLSQGLVGYWKMDETSGNAADSSGNSVTLTNNGTMSYSAGKFGNGANTTVNTKYLSTTTAISGVKTVAFWINPSATTTYPIDLNGTQTITATSGTISANNFTGATIYVNGAASSTLAASSWQHVVVTTNTSFNTGTMTIGLVGSNTMNGSIDDVRIYNRTLSAVEVRALYNWAPPAVARWSFDEGTGQYAYDTSGNSNTGTLGSGATPDSADPSWISGKYGKALSFDGSNDYVSVTDPGSNSILDVTNAITLNAWVKFTTIPDSSGSYIISKGADMYDLLAYNADNGKITFYLTTSGGVKSLKTTDAYNDNNWHHIIGTYDKDAGSNNMKIYIDGLAVNSTTHTGTINADNNRLGIGIYGAANNYEWGGKIDDVRIYNYARTQKQIVEDMLGSPKPVGAGGNAGQPAVAYYKFDEGADNTCSGGVNDACNSGSGGSSLDGAESGMAVPATSTSGWTNSGKFGKGLVFDGSNDYVDAGTNGSLNIGTDLTLEAWFKTTSSSVTVLLNKGTTSDWLYAASEEADGNMLCKIYQSGVGTGYLETVDLGTKVVNDGAWHHIACVVSGTTLTQYIDGKVDATDSTPSGTRDTTSAGGFSIGRFNWTTTYNWSGTIDEVKIYNYALTQDEILTDYNRGASLVLGSISTDSDGSSASFADSRGYCVPGDTTSCAAPVGEWNFEEKTGTSAYDTSGNGYTGTLTNGPTWKSAGRCKKGACLDFNGSTNYVDVGEVSLAGQSAFSIEAWVKLDSLNTQRHIVDKDETGTDYPEYILYVSSNNKVYFWFSTANTSGGWGSPTGSSTTLTTETWYHLAGTYDGSYIRVFINGVLDPSSPITRTGTPYDNNDNTFIGAGKQTAPPGYGYNFDGLIDQVRIYNYARTPAQIAWDYNQGKPIAHYKFDECQGGTAYDSSENQNNGTITIGSTLPQNSVGTCTDGQSTSAWYNGRNGKYNYSLKFDGADDKVDVNDNASLESSTISISTWVYITGTTGNYQVVAIKGSTDYEISITSDLHPRFGITNSSASRVVWDLTSITLSQNTWYQLALTYDGLQINAYVNGQYIDHRDQTGNVRNSVSGLAIGYLTNTYWLKGQIDDVRIYNYALTATQIKNLYNQGSAVQFAPITGSP